MNENDDCQQTSHDDPSAEDKTRTKQWFGRTIEKFSEGSLLAVSVLGRIYQSDS